MVKYHSPYAHVFYARHFCALLLDGRNASIYDGADVRRDTDIGTWNRPRRTLGSWFLGLIRSMGPFDMQSSRQAVSLNTCAS